MTSIQRKGDLCLVKENGLGGTVQYFEGYFKKVESEEMGEKITNDIACLTCPAKANHHLIPGTEQGRERSWCVCYARLWSFRARHHH
jgi:hypothetical protein